jgi:hypothetical protein
MNNEELFAWVMHHFAAAFEHHAVLKGGMVLRLLDSPRSTTDLDYVFVPYDSKKEVQPQIAAVLSQLQDVQVDLQMHSRMLRASLRCGEAAIQVEVSVATECPSIPMATGAFARAAGQPSQVIRVMRMDIALAHKIAAWNERRLARDLYDMYFLFGPTNIRPDELILGQRLDNVQSRLPALRKKKRMTRPELIAALESTVGRMNDRDLEAELGAILPKTELSSLCVRMTSQLCRLIEYLKG